MDVRVERGMYGKGWVIINYDWGNVWGQDGTPMHLKGAKPFKTQKEAHKFILRLYPMGV